MLLFLGLHLDIRGVKALFLGLCRYFFGFVLIFKGYFLLFFYWNLIHVSILIIFTISSHWYYQDSIHNSSIFTPISQLFNLSFELIKLMRLIFDIFLLIKINFYQKVVHIQLYQLELYEKIAIILFCWKFRLFYLVFLFVLRD